MECSTRSSSAVMLPELLLQDGAPHELPCRRSSMLRCVICMAGSIELNWIDVLGWTGRRAAGCARVS
uniref:Uncharacterized protein n=1 Tax=Arundo donax TaxID=35708 RepID=A0A0A8Y2Z6_ARUDO